MNTLEREQLIGRVRETRNWDLIVIGGGATGLGTAVDAAARGYKALLLEAYDFAKGTSSRSTKLVHGGVRYLEQGHVPLVRQALHERGLLFRNAPHLTNALPFVIPSYHWWEVPFYGTGLTLYDLLAGKLGIGRTRLVARDEALRRIPTLEPQGLLGGVVYYDGQFDDARLAITLLQTLFDCGGTALNYMPVVGLLKEGERIRGVRARDAESGAEYELQARAVVNATGIYVDAIRQMDDPAARAVVVPSRGTHLVLDRAFLPGDHAVMIPHTDDGRVLFIIPWHNRALLGTTDMATQDTPIEPRASEAEIEFLLRTAARYLHQPPRREDVLAVFAGLRPLVKSGTATSTAALSRDHTLMVSRSGLITITGGKWTTYRHMGADTVQRAITVAGLDPQPSVTPTLKLHGWVEQLPDDVFRVYGADAAALKQLMAEQPGWNERLDPDLPYYAGQVVWAVRCELARTVEDVLARRTRALLLDAAASKRAAPQVARLMARELDKTELWERAQVREYNKLADGYLLEPSASVIPETRTLDAARAAD